jgi:prepilin-type processing-associated H-X9-DG protein
MMPYRFSKPACTTCCRWRMAASAILGAAILACLAGRSGLLALDQPSSAPKGALPPELEHVPADAAFFVSLRVADLWNSDAIKALRQQKEQELAEGLKKFEKEVGVGPGDMERATVVMSNFKSRGPVIFITTTKPYDRAKILATTVPGAKAEKHAEQIFFVSDKDRAILFQSDRTYLAGSAEAIRAYLDRPLPREGTLTTALKLAAQKHTATGGFNVTAFAKEEGDRLPPQMEAFKDILKARSATWTVDFGETAKADLRLHFANEAEARRAEKPFRAAIDLLRAGLALGVPEAAHQPGGASMGALLKRIDTGLRSASPEHKGADLQLALTIKADAAVVAELVEGVQRIRQSANVAVSANNLKQLALAMHNYHDTYGHFPPQAIYSKQGKPLLSWRVLLLPYLEQDNLYRQFKLDEAWDGPHNKGLLAQMPKVFADPAVESKDPMTVYQAFVGPGAFFEDKKGLPINEITDGTSNTLMIVEAANPVSWTKPQDLPYDPNQPLPKLGGHRPGGFNAAFCDGSVRFLRQNIKESLLRDLITRNGGEVINPNDF